MSSDLSVILLAVGSMTAVVLGLAMSLFWWRNHKVLSMLCGLCSLGLGAHTILKYLVK